MNCQGCFGQCQVKAGATGMHLCNECSLGESFFAELCVEVEPFQAEWEQFKISLQEGHETDPKIEAMTAFIDQCDFAKNFTGPFGERTQTLDEVR